MIFLYALYNNPLVSIILIFLLNVFMIGYILTIRPFQTIVGMIYFLGNEIWMLLANIGMLMFAAMDNSLPSMTERNNVGNLIIFSYTALFIWNFIYLAYLLIQLARSVYYWIKKNICKIQDKP